MNLMVYQYDELIFQSKSKGIRPHIEAFEKLGDRLNGTVMADRIVGKAAALLILHSKAKKVYTMVITTSGKQILEGRIKFEYQQEVDNIKTRSGSIFCPFERMVQNIDDPVKAYYYIAKRVRAT